MTLTLVSILVATVTLYLVRQILREGEPGFMLHWPVLCETRCYVLPTGEMVMAPVEDKPVESPPPGERPASPRTRQALERLS